MNALERKGDDLLSLGDVCQVLRVSPATVYRLVKRGDLPQPVHVGKASRWRWRDVLKYTSRLRPGLRPAPPRAG